MNSLADPDSSGNGLCTLREAIKNANSPGVDTTAGDCAIGSSTINFSVSGTITLSSALPPITNSLSIDGSGQAITIDGANLYRVLYVPDGTFLSLNNLTIAHGNAGSGDGGAIYSPNNTSSLNRLFEIVIANCTFSGNSAQNGFGGAIFFDDAANPPPFASSVFSDNSVGLMESSSIIGAIVITFPPGISITNSSFSNNSANGGGAIFAGNSPSGVNLQVTNSSFTTNSASYDGGAVACESGSIADSTFTGNSATAGGGVDCYSMIIKTSTFANNSAKFGGGIHAGYVSVTNSTFSGNSTPSEAGDGGGGIYVESARGAVTNSTFSNNTAPAGGSIYSNASNVTLSNSILAGSSASNCFVSNGPALINGGFNISDDASCLLGASTSASGKIIGDNVDPLLDAAGLKDNGPPTQTIAPQASSPAVDAIPIGQCPSTDQLGWLRPAPGHTACDIGAFELGSALPTPILKVTPTKLGFSSVGIGTAKTLAVEIENTADLGVLAGNVAPVSAPFAASLSGPFNLSQGQHFFVYVDFTPTTTGAAASTLVITSNDPNKPSVSVKLTGTGAAAQFYVPTSFAFLNTGVSTTATKTLTIRNLGAGVVNGNVGASTGPFAVIAGGGNFTLNHSETKTVTLQFSPLATGSYTGELPITSDDPKKSSVSVKLSGIGQAGQLSVPSPLSFYAKATTTKANTLTIRNLGLGVLNGNVGASTGPFVVTAGGGAFTLNHLQTKVVTIQFTPPAKGAFAGVLPLLSDDPKHLSFNVNLKGTGQ